MVAMSPVSKFAFLTEKTRVLSSKHFFSDVKKYPVVGDHHCSSTLDAKTRIVSASKKCPLWTYLLKVSNRIFQTSIDSFRTMVFCCLKISNNALASAFVILPIFKACRTP
jgi:hypothetical protein